MQEPTLSYTGTYVANETAADGRPVKVLLQQDGLLLQQDRHTSVFWQADQIHAHAYRKGDQTILKYGSAPVQCLEVVSPTFATDIQQKYPQAIFHKNALPTPKSKKSSLYLLVLLMVGSLLAAYFLLLPAVTNLLVSQLPPSVEVKIGEQLYNQMMQGESIDSARSKTANKFLRQLQLSSAYPLQVTVVRKETVNAFAFPGGHMVLYTGLLDSLATPSELAALLGHEFAHAQKRHSLKSLARSVSTYFLASLIFNDISGLAAVLLENADKLESLQYSRTLEQEADATGFQVLKENQLDPAGMERLFLRLQSASARAETGPALLSTHPLTSERLTHLQTLRQENPYPVKPNPTLQAVWQELQRNK